ncbi:cytochrome P450 [Rhodococcus sp. NPDC056743]|uniref:cytochrome P450 n=1 Tax=Rhodococcus sp. NPDC056743 TaxID=3345934 RepID=UPI00366D7351
MDPFAPPNIENPYPLYAALRRDHPVYRIPETDFYLVSSWELVTEALHRTADFSSNLTGVLVHSEQGSPRSFDLDSGGHAIHVLATDDDPSHQQHRKLVLPTLVAKRIRAMEPLIAHYAEGLWNNHFDSDQIEWVSALADQLPLQMVAHLIGLPDIDVPQLLTWSYDSTELLSGIVTTNRLPEVVSAATQLTGYLYDKLADAQTAPGDNLLGDLVRACDSGEVDTAVAVLMLVQLVGAGGESTAGLISNAARIVAEQPTLQQQLREDSALLAPFLEEALRLESPFRGHHRYVTAATTLGTIDLPAGSHLILLWGSANRDPRAFDNPDALNLDRTNLRTHLAFGRGAHFCVGAALARLEAKIALTLLLAKSKHVSLTEDMPPVRVPSLFVRRHQRLHLTVGTPPISD